jgi:putative acetyltransferase
MQFSLDALRAPDVLALLDEHWRDMHAQSPPESVHALDIDQLRKPGIRFWVARAESGALLGCGALKALDAHHAEIKSMRTVHAARGQGIGRQLLMHLLADAQHQGHHRVSLETGAEPGFAPARALYASAGFALCPPYPPYVEDPNSVFMTLCLTAPAPR